MFGTEDSSTGRAASGSSGITGAADEVRTFTITYRVRGGAIAYDDVIDIGWTVWGDQWDFDLDHLSASFTNPALDPANPDYRVWGHPRDVEGETARGAGVATLEAHDVHDHTAVEFRVTMPRPPGIATSGMQVSPAMACPASSRRRRRSTRTSTRPGRRRSAFSPITSGSSGSGSRQSPRW